MIDASAFQLLLTLLTGWLDRHKRNVLRYMLEENRVFAASCAVDACS